MLDGPQCRSERVRKISPPPEFDPRTVQPVASRYTDWAIPARWIWSIGGNIMTGETEVFGEKPVPMLYPLQISGGLSRDRTLTSAYRGWRLRTWVKVNKEINLSAYIWYLRLYLAWNWFRACMISVFRRRIGDVLTLRKVMQRGYDPVCCPETSVLPICAA
jgi:hypothetical protein